MCAAALRTIYLFAVSELRRQALRKKEHIVNYAADKIRDLPSSTDWCKVDPASRTAALERFRQRRAEWPKASFSTEEILAARHEGHRG